MRRLLLLLLVLGMCASAQAEASIFDEVVEYSSNQFFGSSEQLFFGRIKDIWKAYRSDGSPLLDYEWKEMPDANLFSSLTDSLFAVRPDRSSGCGLMNAAGEWLSEPVYDELSFSGENIVRTKKGGKFGYIDAAGKTIAEPVYESASDFINGFAIVVLDGKYGCIDAEGCYVLSPIYDALSVYPPSVVFKLNGYYGLMDFDGNTLLQPFYDFISENGDGTWTASFNGLDSHFYVQDGKAIPVTTIGSSFDLTDYMPRTGAKTPALDAPATLQLTESNALPRLDGATALFPLYSGVVQAIYPQNVNYVHIDEATPSTPFTFSNTTGAYERLCSGECDLIFVAPPSDQQKEMAAANGVELELTTIGYEAFVFFVNQNNPLDGLATEQIRGIYSGKITDWSDLGAEEIGEIVAYQRPANSGSQSALERLMGDVPLMDPPANGDSSIAFHMTDIVDVVEYRNVPNAIGYSFRFFLTEMMGSEVKLLSVDGVAPTEENIRNQTYPLITPICAVCSADNDDPNLRALLNWLTTDQGKDLISRSGYTPS